MKLILETFLKWRPVSRMGSDWANKERRVVDYQIAMFCLKANLRKIRQEIPVPKKQTEE